MATVKPLRINERGAGLLSEFTAITVEVGQIGDCTYAITQFNKSITRSLLSQKRHLDTIK